MGTVAAGLQARVGMGLWRRAFRPAWATCVYGRSVLPRPIAGLTAFAKATASLAEA